MKGPMSHAVLGQAYPDTKCSCRIIEKISIKFLRGALTIIIILAIFAGISLKLEKVGRTL